MFSKKWTTLSDLRIMVNICGNSKKLKGYLSSLCETIQRYCKMHISVQISNSLNFPVNLHTWQCLTVAGFVAAVSYTVKAAREDELLEHLCTGKDPAALCGLAAAEVSLGSRKVAVSHCGTSGSCCALTCAWPCIYSLAVCMQKSLDCLFMLCYLNMLPCSSVTSSTRTCRK